MKKRARFRGHIDRIVDGYLFGWLFDYKNPERSVVFDLFIDGKYRGQWCCSYLREDLVGAGLGNGIHGFKIPVSTDVDANIDPDSVEIFVPSANALWLSTRDLHFRTNNTLGATKRARLERFRTRLVAGHDGQSADRSVLNDASAIATVLSTSVVYGKNRLGKLETSDFTEFLRRLRKPNCSDAEFYNFYVNDYIFDLDARFVPMSDEERRFIKDSIERNRVKILTSLVPKYIWLFNNRVFNALSDTYSIYWWTAEGGHQLKLDYSCVLPGEITRLRERVPYGFGSSFPLTYFMMIFAFRNRLVSPLAMLLPSGRRRVHEWCFDYAQNNSHIRELISEGVAPRSDSNKSIVRSQTHEGWTVGEMPSNNKIGSKNSSDSSNKKQIPYAENSTKQKKNVPIQFVGPLDKILGLGESSRRLLKAVREVEPECNFVCYNNGIQSASTGESYAGNLRPAAINIIHLNAEQIPEFFLQQGAILSESYNIIYPYWELSEISSLHLLGLSLVDEVWAASTFIGNAFRAHGLPVTTVGLPAFNLEALANCDQKTSTKFTFLTTFDAFSWPQRKNAIATVDAFLVAFEGNENVRLIVKTQNADRVHSEHQQRSWIALRERCDIDDRIEIINETYSPLRQRSLLRASDCLVSLHRAEGLGIDVLDAISSGIPVVATAYSGNMDICTSSNCWLVEYDLIDVDQHEYVFVEEGHRWANARHLSAVETLRNVFYKHSDRKVKSLAGIADADRLNSLMAVSARIAERLSSLRRTVITKN